ncbi:hypothetical protein EJ08DRAFT_93691 [Tothia fuscella]|uniref:Uncharacterized protein n=1 Tax=Tothia fuscella TaxID=1048955 RepID=A0A9P4NWU3_9PEZI|nr:hypothetical protein EJ08DRAFT_93691 [Tothia fuscella]
MEFTASDHRQPEMAKATRSDSAIAVELASSKILIEDLQKQNLNHQKRYDALHKMYMWKVEEFNDLQCLNQKMDIASNIEKDNQIAHLQKEIAQKAQGFEQLYEQVALIVEERSHSKKGAGPNSESLAPLEETTKWLQEATTSLEQATRGLREATIRLDATMKHFEEVTKSLNEVLMKQPDATTGKPESERNSVARPSEETPEHSNRVDQAVVPSRVTRVERNQIIAIIPPLLAFTLLIIVLYQNVPEEVQQRFLFVLWTSIIATHVLDLFDLKSDRDLAIKTLMNLSLVFIHNYPVPPKVGLAVIIVSAAYSISKYIPSITAWAKPAIEKYIRPCSQKCWTWTLHIVRDHFYKLATEVDNRIDVLVGSRLERCVGKTYDDYGVHLSQGFAEYEQQLRNDYLACISSRASNKKTN